MMKAGAKSNKKAEFELCEVCNLNHDQGRRHKHFPSHRRSLASLLSRFQAKLADIRFFVRNPTFLRPENSAANRLWCVSCSLDLQELGSPFACSNAINHLASPEHLKNLKEFLWRHGGGMDLVDSFTVSEEDFAKWEKSCSLLKGANSLSCEGPIGPQMGPSKDIQNDHTTNNTDNFQNNSIGSFHSSISNAVMPLQSLTYEGYRSCHSEVSGITSTGSTPYIATSLSMGTQGSVGHQCMPPMGSVVDSLKGESVLYLIPAKKTKHQCPNGKGLAGSSQSKGVVQRTVSGESCTQGLAANVHTGALPPWLEPSQESERNHVDGTSHMSNHGSLSAPKKKLGKLNPKRVGAAWAEWRKVELEMEKRGEIGGDVCDANWLPNFGRVWQSGSRKESRKEFKIEKQKFFKEEIQPEKSADLKPYISKRMKVGPDEKDDASGSKVKDLS